MVKKIGLRRIHLKKEEYAYIHLQKRKIKMELNNKFPDRFLIVPNSFIPYEEISGELVHEYSKGTLI